MSLRFEDRMSDADALLWNIELDPMLRSTIVSVMLLDQEPDAKRFAGAIERSLVKIPRLRQRVVLDPLRVAPPRWETDPHFELDYHVRHVRAAGSGSERELLDLAEPIGMQAFDKDRPLWELYQVDGLHGGASAIVMKLHHAISDGVGLVRMTSSLVERSREPDPRRETRESSLLDETPSDPVGPFQETLKALRHRAGSNLDKGTRAARALGRGARALASDPGGAVSSAARMAKSLGKSLRPVSEPLSPVMRGRSLGVGYDTFSVSLDELKKPAKAVGGTLNDAFIAAVTGGLRLYHERHGQPVDALRMTMPVNLRQGDEGDRAGNQFAPARFAVPIAITDPVERMRRIKASVRSERDEPALPMAEEIAGLIGRLPRAISAGIFGSMLKAIDIVTSNVPGPPFPVYMSGARVERMFGFGPLSGSALNVTLFSYDGYVHIAANRDPAAIPDGDVLAECLRAGVAEVLAVR
jgi:WS/DGAT/MGAT family acyltransferase